jgi:serine/threonine protein phosphatase PrpC
VEKTSIAGRTDVGCKRSNNEDAFAISQLESGLLAIVADGMGGHHGGEVASELAVNCFVNEVQRQLAQGEVPQYAMTGGGQVAHTAIRQHARSRPELGKMGTTLVSIFLRGHDLHVIHAGDSRCYVYDGKLLQQVTRDHSVVQQMIDGGALQAEDAEKSPFRNLLTNSLAASQELVSLSYQRFPVEKGNRILLCSDGLTNSLSPEQISAIMTNQAASVDRCVEQLIEQSLAHEAQDNVTVIVVQVGDKDQR